MPLQLRDALLPCRLGCAGQVLGLNPRLFDENFVIDPSRVRGCCLRHGGLTFR